MSSVRFIMLSARLLVMLVLATLLVEMFTDSVCRVMLRRLVVLRLSPMTLLTSPAVSCPSVESFRVVILRNAL